MPFAGAVGLLSGLTVIEAQGEVATRYCGRLCAALGARVVQVGDRSADAVSHPGEAGRAFAAWLDAGKERVPDLAAALKAAPDAALVIAGQYSKAVREIDGALGDREILRLGLTWFGAVGPYAGWRGHDALIQSLSGLAFSFGEPYGAPTIPQGHAPQIIGGLTGFIASLAALMSGGARRVDVNVFEASLCLTEIAAVSVAGMPGAQSGRPGVNRHAPIAPSSIYPTKDGHIGLTTVTPAQWSALCKLIGRNDLGMAPQLATAGQRWAYADAIDTLLGPLIAAQTTDYWVRAGDEMRIPITPAPRPRELPALPHWRARNSFEAIDGAKALGPTLPFRIDADGVTDARPDGGADGPLTGVRVADFTMGWAGPLATRYLADLGAEVLKIESKAKPDWWRGWEAMADTDPPLYEFPLNFMATNRGKRGLDVDVTKPHGIALARSIIERADLVIDNQGPGVMDKLGLGPAEQRALRPGVISISMPPFGRTGPLSGLRAYGSTVEQASGMPFVNGHEEWTPAMQHVAYGDPIAGLYGAAAALAGLYGRSTVGGTEIDLSQVECAFQLGADLIIADQIAPLVRAGNRRPGEAPSCVVPTAGYDSWLAVVVESDVSWRALCGVLGVERLDADWAFAARCERCGLIEDALAGWAAPQTAQAAAAKLQAAGVAAAPVTPSSDLWLDKHLLQAGYWSVLNRRYVGDHLAPNAPILLDGRRVLPAGPAPTLGQHTVETLAALS